MKKIKMVEFLIAFLVATAGVIACNGVNLDNDSWDILAEGREIVENGLYYEDQLSMHDGLEVTVQNYGFAVIFYLIYAIFGWAGIYVGMSILNLLIVLLLYKICMLLSDGKINLSLLIAVLTDLLLARWFVVTRAQMVSYVIMLGVIYLLELYVRRGKIKTLFLIPILAFVQINLHASLWPMILIILGVYLVDGIKCPKLKLDGYKKKPLVMVLIATILISFLNPYGLKMMTFILTSYGIPEANKYINELEAFSFKNSFSVLLYASVVVTMILYIFAKKEKVRMRYLILTFGFLALGLNTIKGMSQLILVLLFPLAEVYKEVKTEKWGNRKIQWMVASWAGAMAVLVITVSLAVRAAEMIEGPHVDMIEAVDALDAANEGIDKKSVRLYVGYDHGGYAEYRGYRPYLDPRMEVFLKANNGKEDIFQEWYKLEAGKLDKKEFLDKYNFDYLLVIEGEQLYNLDTDEYAKIFEKDKGEEYSGIRVYKKIKM